MRNSRIKAALLEAHSIIGLVLSLVLAVMGMTGAMMSFEDEIQASLNAGITHVEPRTTAALTPDELVARLQAAGGYGKVSGMTLASDPSAAVRIRFARTESGARPTSVYVDPYDGHVLGTARGEEFFAAVRRLHRWLMLPGDSKGYGRQITGVAAIGLLMLMISGLALRWPKRATSVKMWLKPGFALRGRGLHRSLHAVFGTWVLPVYLVTTTTGLWYSFDWYREGAISLLSRPSIAAAPAPSRSPRSAGGAAAKLLAGPLSLDRVWSTFLHEQGGRFATAQLTLPPGAGTIVRVRSLADASNEGARDEFRIDAVTGRMVSSSLYADKTAGERILSNILEIHRGRILGWPGALAFMVAAALMPLFAITGFLLFLSRRRHRRLSQPSLKTLVPGE